MKRNLPRLVTGAALVLALMALVLALGGPGLSVNAQTNASSGGPYRLFVPMVSKPAPYPPPVMLQRLAAAEALYPAIRGHSADSCALCHEGQAPAREHPAGQYNLNHYGGDFRDFNYNFGEAQLERIDSDGDQIRNGDELRAGSNPGDLASTPGGNPPPPLPVQQNQLSNPDFETWNGSTPASWSVSGGGSASSSTDAHSGGRSIRLDAASGSVVIESNFFPVRPNQVVDASIWLKWQGISGDIYNGEGLRMDLYAFDSSKSSSIKRWQMADVDGASQAWRHLSNLALMPANAAWARVRVQISSSSGTAWVDDAYARIVQDVPAVDNSTAGPVIVPHPRQIHATGATLPLGNTAIVHPGGEDRLHAAVENFYSGAGLSHTYLAPGDPAPGYETLVRFGDRNSPDIASAFNWAFGGNSWNELGDEGYFLTVQKPAGRVQILVGANSEQGRFYALQSIKQIVKNGQIYALDVLDVPTLPVRGIVMSSARYNNYSANLDKVASLKMNFAWSQGTFMSNKFNYNWRQPLTASEQNDLRGYLVAARARFITPWISIGPRATSAGSNSTCYGCDTDINLAVQKFDVLYGLGLRNFGLNFDDLNNVGQQTLYFQGDISQFGGDLAEAHKYFTTQVYNRLKALHSDISMMIIPFPCYLAGTFAPSQDHYMQVMAGLPSAIGIYSVQYYSEDYLRNMQLVGRPTVNWSNFYAEGYVPSTANIAPHYNLFDATNSTVKSAVSGLTYLPLQPSEEDSGNVSWYTTSDYFWAPDRYDPNQSFQSAVAKNQGK